MVVVFRDTVPTSLLLRIYIIFLTEQLGGARAAELIKQRVQAIHTLRTIRPPTTFQDMRHEMKLSEYYVKSAMAEREASARQT